MKTKTFKLIACMVLSLALLAGCSLQASKTLDLGKMEGTKYTNEYFGMALDVPEGWAVQSKEEKEAMMKKAMEAVAKNDEKLKKMMEAGQYKTYYLLTAFKNPVGTQAAGFNPNFMCMAEKLSLLQGAVVKTGKQYLELTKNGLKQTKMPYKFDKEMYTEKLGGKDFDVMETVIEAGNMKIMQKYYAKVLDGYALTFIASYADENQKKELDGILKSVRFE